MDILMAVIGVIAVSIFSEAPLRKDDATSEDQKEEGDAADRVERSFEIAQGWRVVGPDGPVGAFLFEKDARAKIAALNAQSDTARSPAVLASIA